jgi:acyl dehydratase
MTIEMTVSELASRTTVDLGETSWWPVSQDRVDLFADATQDHQWIHVDPERAIDGPFGGTIAHGYLVLSLIPAMVRELFHVSDRARGINYGLDRVRFLEPVRVGGALRLSGTISGIVRREDGGVRYRTSATVLVRGADRPAVLADTLTVVYPEVPGAEAGSGPVLSTG